MKKFIGAICSGVAGVVTLIMLCFDWMVAKVTMAGETMLEQKLTGWNLLTNKMKGESAGMETFKGAYTLYKVAAIIMLIVAILLIAYAVVLLLKNLNVIKFNFKFNLVNNILLTVLVATIVAAFAAIAIMAINFVKEASEPAYELVAKMFPAVCAWIALAVSAAACACGWALTRKSK